MKRIIEKARTAALTLSMAFFSLMGRAQIGGGSYGESNNMGTELLDSATSGLSNILRGLVEVLRVGLGIGAVVMLVMVVFRVLKEEREAATKLIWWLIGIVLGFTFLTIVSNFALQNEVGAR